MAAITQLQLSALSGRRYGSFGGKSAMRPVGVLTQLHLNALPGMRYGEFAGKGAGAAVVRRRRMLLGVGH